MTTEFQAHERHVQTLTRFLPKFRYLNSMTSRVFVGDAYLKLA
jgi:hypothetical protein